MKPDYKNWFPKGLVVAIGAGFALFLLLFFLFGVLNLAGSEMARVALAIIFGSLALIFFVLLEWSISLRKAFSYDGKRQLAKHITEGVAQYVTLPQGGVGLDVGCGSGALTIAAAKKNPQATMVGLDRWGKEYGSYSKQLCEHNAKAEGVSNVKFVPGNALKLDYPDETFDAVTSNYVYHNISGKDKQALLLETLRTLKKGGIFAIHDIMSPRRYGDMHAFIDKLKSYGYEKVELIDTADGMFMDKEEAKKLMLDGSMLLVGKK